MQIAALDSGDHGTQFQVTGQPGRRSTAAAATMTGGLGTMIGGGALTITLDATDGTLATRVDAPPMLSLTRMLGGKPIAEAAQMAGMVHAVGPAAETAAVLTAASVPVPEAILRDMLYEALHGHLAKMNHAWPTALGLPVTSARLPTYPSASAFSLALFGQPEPPRRLAELEAWIKRGAVVAARALEQVWGHWDGRWGRAALPLWSPDMPLGIVDWNEAVMDGQPVETGIAARVADTDLMREAEARRGRGIAWRLIARIADAAALIDRLAERRFDGLVMQVAPHVGAALAHNGTLLVDLDTAAGCVTRYQRLSPADFALHPRGLLERTLHSLPVRPRPGLEAVASLGVEAVDPGLPTHIVVTTRQAA